MTNVSSTRIHAVPRHSRQNGSWSFCHFLEHVSNIGGQIGQSQDCSLQEWNSHGMVHGRYWTVDSPRAASRGIGTPLYLRPNEPEDESVLLRHQSKPVSAPSDL